MYDVKDTQLPSTATPLAQALDILEERLFGLPVQMITKDPWTVDVALLDYLAWEHSVDVWDLDWPDDVKRGVIAASSEVHRFKGTPYGIRLALLSFGVDVELVEWWQPEGSGVPGTFTARAFVTDPLNGSEEFIVTSPVVAAMKAMLNGVSPVSRGWALQLGVRAFAHVYVGAFSQTHITAEARYLIDPPPALNAALTTGVLAHTEINATAITV